ncbi:MAG: hypothetical protein GF411_00435 [Candidatus Lokiarchaeota archaeon]|nr:hypothetical protein [Candidatus Lokiarchaeota archaeon]
MKDSPILNCYLLLLVTAWANVFAEVDTSDSIDSLIFGEISCKEINDVVAPDAKIFAYKNDDTVSLIVAWGGNAGCNNYKTDFKMQNDTLNLVVKNIGGSCEGVLSKICLYFGFIWRNPKPLVVIAEGDTGWRKRVESLIDFEKEGPMKNLSNIYMEGFK